MIVMIDNYDSFTYNLVQYLSQLGKEVQTLRNDSLTVEQVFALKPELIVISPGPGRPEEAGICLELLSRAHGDVPIFGVCLGFQAMVQAYGGKIIHAPYLMHGKASLINHDGSGIFQELPSPLKAIRYHSLMAEGESMPACFHITARTQDGLVMGIRHREKNMQAVQFHPESYLTEHGQQMIANLFATVTTAKD